MANITVAAPPRTPCGTAATTAAAFGSMPRMIMIRPAATTTNRLLTLVMRTRPTFSAKAT